MVGHQAVFNVGRPMGEAHTGEQNTTKAEEGENEQGDLDPRVGWMNVSSHVGLG